MRKADGSKSNVVINLTSVKKDGQEAPLPNNELLPGSSQNGSALRQVRWVIKASDGKLSGKAALDDKASHDQPIPAGFRLAVDADPSTPNVKENPDDVDPDRKNTGWKQLTTTCTNADGS